MTPTPDFLRKWRGPYHGFIATWSTAVQLRGAINTKYDVSGSLSAEVNVDHSSIGLASLPFIIGL